MPNPSILSSLPGEPVQPPRLKVLWMVYHLRRDGAKLTREDVLRTARRPEIAQALASLPGGPHVIDGEACVIGPDGVSDFNLLQERARRRRAYPGAPQVTLCAFDVLVSDGKRVMDLPLVRRKQLLQGLLAGLPKAHVLYVGDLPADPAVFQAMVEAGLKIEGVVAKRRASTYQPGVRSPDWLKIKRPGWNEGRNWKG